MPQPRTTWTLIYYETKPDGSRINHREQFHSRLGAMLNLRASLLSPVRDGHQLIAESSTH